MPITVTPERMAQERRLRYRLALAAYAYEILDGAITIMSDAQFDYECQQVDLSIPTGDPKWDKWWIDNFDPSTGMWIYNHPELGRLGEICGGILRLT